MRLSWIITVLAAASVALGACSHQDRQRRVVSVTIPPQKWLLQQIVGDRYEVNAILPPGANPESFEPEMQQLIDLQNSAAYFKAGMPGFEESLLAKMRDNFQELPVFDSSQGIRRIEGTHASTAGKHQHGTDPHVWTSLKNARVMAANMLRHMIEIDPEGADYYRDNFKALNRRLQALDDSISTVLARHRDAAFIVWHPSLSYFARDYGLRQIAMESDGKEASVKQLREQVDAAGSARPLLFFLQEEYDARGARSLAGEMGVPTATISVMQPDIAWQARSITKAINEH